MSPSEINTAYYLRTRRNLHVDLPIEPDAANITSSPYDPTKPTKIIVHGFMVCSFLPHKIPKRDDLEKIILQILNSGLAKWVPEVTQAILFQEDVNVIQIDWVKGANVEYDHAASNTRVVGAQIAYLINMLMVC